MVYFFLREKILGVACLQQWEQVPGQTRGLGPQHCHGPLRPSPNEEIPGLCSF